MKIDTLINTVRVFSDDIRMQLDIGKCAILTMKRGKTVKCDGISLPDNKIVKSFEAES